MRQYYRFADTIAKLDINAEVVKIRNLIDGFPRGQYLLKMMAIMLLLEGAKLSALAVWFRVQPETIKAWAMEYLQDPDSELFLFSRGRPRQLTFEEERLLFDAFLREPNLKAKGLVRVMKENNFERIPTLRTCQRLIRQFRLAMMASNPRQKSESGPH